jgi:hypothetical protein
LASLEAFELGTWELQERPNAKKLHSACVGAFELQARKLIEGSRQFFCVLPPTFNTKSWRLSAIFFTFGMFWSFQTWSLKVPFGVEAKKFVLGLQLSVPKDAS